MTEPDDILETILTEAGRTLEEMKATGDLEARQAQSEILHNLCHSAGIFFDLMSNTMMPDGFPEFMELEEDEEDEE